MFDKPSELAVVALMVAEISLLLASATILLL